MIPIHYATKGFDEELIFKRSIEKYQEIECKKSSTFDDMHKHIDFYMGNGWSVDCKTSNKIFNGSHHIWIELTNVRGNRGWIDGEATHIAFSLGDKYVFFKREELRLFIRKKLSSLGELGNLHTKTQKSEIYKIYRRIGLQDKIVLVPLSDILDNIEGTYMKRDYNLLGNDKHTSFTKKVDK